MKKTRASYSNNVKMIAVFVAGLAVATLGWYYSDRLNVAFGRSADIDVIGVMKDDPTPPVANCKPGDKPHTVRRLEGCELITQTVSCLPVQRYLNTVKTHTGAAMYESTIPKRFSKPITKYETATHIKLSLIEKELSSLDSQIAEYRKTKPASALAKDDLFRELTASQLEVRELRRKMVPTECPPGLLTK